MKLFPIFFIILCLMQNTLKADPSMEIFSKVNQVLDNDIILGNKDSSVVVVEYSSLGCPHCAEYHKYIFPEVKKKYIDTGVIMYITRDFPINSASVMGAMLGRCNLEKRQKILDVLLESQHVWAYKSDFENSLKNIMVLSGMSEESFNNCVNNAELRDALMASSYSAAKEYNISGTPTIFINGKKVDNVMSVEEIDDIINSSRH